MSYLRYFDCPVCHAPDSSFDGESFCEKCKLDYRLSTNYVDQGLWVKDLSSKEEDPVLKRN